MPRVLLFGGVFSSLQASRPESWKHSATCPTHLIHFELQLIIVKYSHERIGQWPTGSTKRSVSQVLTCLLRIHTTVIISKFTRNAFFFYSGPVFQQWNQRNQEESRPISRLIGFLPLTCFNLQKRSPFPHNHVARCRRVYQLLEPVQQYKAVSTAIVRTAAIVLYRGTVLMFPVSCTQQYLQSFLHLLP